MSLKRSGGKAGEALERRKSFLEFFSTVQKKEVIESTQLLHVNVTERFGSCAPATGIWLPGCEMMQKAKKGTFWK